MSTRGNQAYNDGRLAYRENKGIWANPRKSKETREEWARGYEFERGLDRVTKATPEQIEESKRVAASLKDWARDYFK